MSAEVSDVSLIQDEDLLRRMWQQTEDFGRKKEIRARMYKLREQRLKEFYTTGEVLSDVLSTSTSSLDGSRRDVSASNLKNSQSSSQIINKSSSYTTSSSGGGYSITHADSLADEGFLTLKSKEIRDSESPTREFHQCQERNAKNESSSSSTGGGRWRIVQESSEAYESASTTGEGGDVIIRTTNRNEHRNLAGDSEHEGFTTTTQVSSSEQKSHVPRSSSAIELDTTGDKCITSVRDIEDASGHNVALSANRSYSEKWSSSSSTSYSASSNQQYERNEKTSTVSSSTVRNAQDSKESSGLEDSSVTVTESARVTSSTGASHDIVSSSTTASNQISSSQGSKHRVTQRSQTGELIGRTTQSTNETTDIKSPATDKLSGTVEVTTSSLKKDGSTCSNNVVEQNIMSELHKLDSFLSTQNTAADSVPVSPGDARDSSSWTIVSSDKNRTVNNATDEFVFRSGRTTQDKKDSTTQQNTAFIEQERTSAVMSHSYDVEEPADSVLRNTDAKTPTTVKEDKLDVKKPTSEASEGSKRGASTQDTNIGKDGTDATGQYVTTYQQAYTNKRISVDLSPTHEAFARSLRASPERATPPSSTRSSSKTSLDRSSPDRFNKSPTRTYRNRTSLENSLAMGRTSPDKTPKNRSSPTRASPEKSTKRVSPSRSSPDKTSGQRSSPSRVSPEKTRYPEGTSTRTSPERITKSPYSSRASPEKTEKSPTTDINSVCGTHVEKTTRTPQNDTSPSRASPEKRTKPLYADRTSPTIASPPDKTQHEKTSHLQERRVSSGDKPHEVVATYPPTRKTSDSIKSYSSVLGTSGRDAAVTATMTKEKRKLSSGLSRATTKKRSSTPGVSPHTSPTRGDETTPTERQSRPRSRGTSSRSSTDTEDSDIDIKSKKTIHVIDTEDETDKSSLKTIIRTTTDDTEITTKVTEFDRTNTESYKTDEETDIVLSSEVKRKPHEQLPKARKPSADYYPHEDDKPSEKVSEDDYLEKKRTQSSSSSPERAPVVSSDNTTVSRKISSEDTVTAKTVKRKDSTPITVKTPAKKSTTEEPFQPTERSTSPQKSKPDTVGTKVLPSSQKPSDSSLYSSPIDVSPPTHAVSPKSSLDKLPRDKSPEYSSEGSLVNELYPRQSPSHAPRDVSSPVKQLRDDMMDSPDSSPERGNFKPIKCFRTSPEIRPSTLEFAHLQKQTNFTASSDGPESPTKPFKKKPGDDVTTGVESETEQHIKPLTELSTRHKPTKPSKPKSTRDTDFKKSPERPNTSPVFENDDITLTSSQKFSASTRGKPDIFNTKPSTPLDTFPTQFTKQKTLENKDKSDQHTQSPTTKRTPEKQTRKYPQGSDTTIANGAPEQLPPGHTVGKPSQHSQKPEEVKLETGYDEIQQFLESERNHKKQDQEADKKYVHPSEEPRSSSISPCSFSPQRALTTTTAEITLKVSSPVKKSAVLLKPGQCPSDSSPERESLKRHTTSTSSQPQKPGNTASPKQIYISNRNSDTPTTPDKLTIRKSDHSLSSPSQSPQRSNTAPEPGGKHPVSKVIVSPDSSQMPSRDPYSACKSQRQTQKSSPLPLSSPDRTSPNRTTHKDYNSFPESRRSPSPSPRRVSDHVIHVNKVSRSPDQSPSSSPERHRSPVKIRPAAVKSSTKPSTLPQSSSPSSSPEKRSRIPNSCIRDRPHQSPARPSQPSTRSNQNMSRTRQSSVYPTQKSSRPNQSQTRTSNSPARPSQSITRNNHSPARYNQSPARPSSSPFGSRYQPEKPKKPGSDTVPNKSAFVRTPRKPEDGTHFPKTVREPGHTSEQYPTQESPSKQSARYVTRLSPSTKGCPTTKEPRRQKPDEVDEEPSTDRSSTVSSPETVKTAGDCTNVDAVYFASTKVTGQQVIATSHKRTEMYVPQLSRDRDSSPSDIDQDDKPVSLSSVTGTRATKMDEFASKSVTVSLVSNKKATKDILQNKQHKGYYSDEYDMDNLQEETPPEEFLVEDDSPVESPIQSYSSPGKPQRVSEGVRHAPQTHTPKDDSPKSRLTGSTAASSSGRALIATSKISKKSTTRIETQKTKRDPHLPAVEKQAVPLGQSKSRSKSVTTADTGITRSSSDINVIRKQAPSQSGVQPRRQTSKPEIAITRTTITRNTSPAQEQVPTIASTTSRVSSTRTTKIPAAVAKPTLKKVIRTEETNRVKDRSKSTVTTSVKNQTVTKNLVMEIKSSKPTKKKLVNGVSDKVHTSSSEDEQEVPEAVTYDEKQPTFIYTDDEHDETYIKELEELRRKDELQYASKVTAERVLEHTHLSPSQDVPGVIIQPLKSSRESSPEYPRRTLEDRNKPRYADRISEPEDDDYTPGQNRTKPTVFQKPVMHTEAFDEEYTDDAYKPKTKQPAEYSQPKECPGYIIPHPEQVTDLDEESETDLARKSVSVADRVSHFLETTRNASRPVTQPSEPTRSIISSPKSLDSPSTVRRARAMFETIASSKTSTHKDTARQRETASMFETYHDSPREYLTLDNSHTNLDQPSDQENQKGPGSTSPFGEGQYPHEQDVLSRRSDTEFSAKRPSISEYLIDAEKCSPHYRDSHPVLSNENAEKPRTPLTDTYVCHKSPSPECPTYQEPPRTKSPDKSPTSKVHSDTYPRHKPSVSPDRPGNKNYDTYTKVKSKEITPGSKPTMTQRESSPSRYDTFSLQQHECSDMLLSGTSPQKDDLPIKKVSQKEASFNTYSRQKSSHHDSPECRDSFPTRKDSLPKKGQSQEYPKLKSSQGTYLTEKDAPPTKNESVPERGTPQDTHPRRQPVRKDFPEDTLIQTFTKDTTTQREILRQKDILNRSSVFEARHSGQKLAPSTKPEQLNHPYELETSGSSDRYPSDNDIPAKSGTKYSTDTFTKEKPSSDDATPSRTETYPNQKHPQEVYISDTAYSMRGDSQPKKQFSGDTYPRRKPSKDDTSPTRKESAPRKDSPVRQETVPGSRRDFPVSNDSYPRRGGSPQTSVIVGKDQPDVSPSRKSTTSRDDITPWCSSPTRKISSPKDKPTTTVNDMQLAVTSSVESSLTRKYLSLKDTSPTRKESYPKGESPRDSSPTRKHPSPKDTSPTRKDSYPKGESRDSSPTRKRLSPKGTSPIRKDSYPKEDFPRDSSSTTKPSPKDTSPTRRDSYPKGEYHRDSSPTGKHSSQRDTSPTIKGSCPKGESPRDSFSTRKDSSPKDTSPARKDSYPKGESHRDSSPTGKYTSPKDMSPARKDSYPKGESHRDSSPTGKYTSPKDTSPSRKDSYPKGESPRDRSPVSKHSSPKDTSPARKDSYPKGESRRGSSPTAKHSSPKDTSPTRKDSHPKGESPPKNLSPTRKDSCSSIDSHSISSLTRKLSFPKDTSPTRMDSYPRAETLRESSPTGKYSAPVDKSPSRNESHPLNIQGTDVRCPRSDSPTNWETSAKGTSPTRPETKCATRCHPKEGPKPVETSIVRGSGRFGVNLRHTVSAVGSTVQQHLSGETPRPATTLAKKGDEPNIEEIFDLELLERMLEKAVGYEQRRAIRAQIRIVRRLMAERSTITDKLKEKTGASSDSDFEQFSAGDRQEPMHDGDFNRKPNTEVERKMSPTYQKPFMNQQPDIGDSRPFERQLDDVGNCQKPSSSPQRSYPETSSPKAQDSEPCGSHLESYSQFPRDSKPAPEKTPDWKSSPVRKPSKTELSIELKPAALSPVKSPIKKSSLGEPPREAFPTDSVTSSYGVGPTDENGRPLFGLSALRRRQSTNNNIQIPQDTVDNAPTSELEPEDKPQEVESKPSEILDSSGRPLFGGLRALKATTTISRSSSSPQDRNKIPTTEDNMPEQPVSSHLRELVSKHEQNSRGNTVSQPTAPHQKPRAKLRDSFIHWSQNNESDKHSSDNLTDTRLISQRANSLRAIIQKHEKIAHDGTGSDKVPHSSEDVPDTGDTEVAHRPGILKKSHGGDQVVTENTSTTSATVISSRGTLKADGTVSLKRDIIQGETVARLGEEPVSRITRTLYTYNTPEDKHTSAALCYDQYDYDQSDVTRKSSTSSRSSTGKTPSPERQYPDDDVKLSRIMTSSVTSSNSSRRSKVSEDDKNEYDKFSSTATHDIGRSKVIDRITEDKKKFVNSATSFLSQRQNVTDENAGIPSCSSPENTDAEAEGSTVRDRKYISSTTTTITQPGRTPLSVHDDVDKRKTTYSYGKYSSSSCNRSEAGREVTSYFLDSERSTGSGDNRKSLLSSYDDESDGYQYTLRTVTESDTSRSSRRYSAEGETEEQMQSSSSSSSFMTQNHSGIRTAVETSTSSRSSTPKQMSESGRRRSSATFDGDQETSSVPSTGSSGFSRVARGGSVRALSQKFQQAAGSTNVKQSVSVDVHTGSTPNSTHSISHAETEGKSFLTNQTRVSGVQDVITRMKNADQDVKASDSEEDAEARSLLNKFLGAQVILQGMEPLVKASQSQSAALVSQVERQRVLTSQKTTTTLTNSKNLEQDLEEIWDERLLRQLLEKCSDYEGRRQIRARLRVVMAEQKACAGIVAAALADEEAASEREQEEMGEVLHHSVEEGESMLLPLLVEQLRSSLLLEKKCTGCATPLAPQPHSLSGQSSSEEGQVGKVEDSSTESGEDLKLLAVGLRDSIEFHRQQSHDISTQKINSTSGSTEPLSPSLLMEVQTALSRLQASLQLGSIGEGQGEVLDPARRDALLQLVSRLQASLRLPAPPDKENPKTDGPEIMHHPSKQSHTFKNKRIFHQNRHTVAVTKEELADARRLVEENATKNKLISNSHASRVAEIAPGLVQQSSAGNLAVPEDTTVASSVAPPVMRAFRPVHFDPRHSLSGSMFNGNASAKPFFFLSQLQNSGVSKKIQSQAENRRSSCGDLDINSDNTSVTNLNGIQRHLEQSVSLDNPCHMNNAAVSEDTKPELKIDFSVTGDVKNVPHCTVKKESDYNQDHPQSDKHVCMQPMTAVHREYRPGKLGQEGIRPIQKSGSLDSSNSATQSVISLAEHAIQKAPVYSSSTSSTASSKASTPLRSDSGNSVPEKTVHNPVSKASSLDSSSSSKASTPQRSDSGTSVGERVAYKHVSQASAPQRSHSGPSVAERLHHRSVSQGSALNSTSTSKSDSGSSLPSRHIQKPLLSSSSSPHRAVSQSVSLDSGSNNVAVPQGSTPDHRAISHSLSLDSDSRDYDPSVLLFTPAQSVQIAVHKAAINKQLSLEEEKRQRVNAQSHDRTYDSEDDDGSEVDASSEDEGSSETDEEEEENTSTVRQAAIDEKNQVEISNKHHIKNEDNRHSQTDVNCMQVKTLNTYNLKQKITEQDSGKNDKQDAGKMPDTIKNTQSNSEHWNQSTVNQNSNQQNLQNVCPLPNNTKTDTNNGNNCINVSSAQRLLQMATEDTKAVVRKPHEHSDRKVKMKRANTIDIPKPLSFYEIEEETDYSSGEEYEGERDSKPGTNSTSDQHRAAYLALRGPIRVGSGNKAFGNKLSPPTFQPKTESDRKFLAFLQQHSNGKGSIWREDGVAKTTTYNPSARGGHHWSSRFTNIKTAFEKCAGRGGGEPGKETNLASSGPAAARMFWQSADDSVTVMKSAAANGPKLTRQGSIFLRKLFEQKEQQQQSKLPWTEKNAVSDDSVVVGSLTVAASTGTVLSKKQLFTPPQSPATFHAPLNINKFSHAPMSAFQPIEKKQTVDTVNQSVSGNMKQLENQKFTTASKPSKQRTSFTQQTKQELLSPVSPTLPWTRDGIQQEHRVLNTAIVKFENISRETSPQPASLPLPRSRSQEKINVPGNLSVFVKQQHTPVPAPRSYVPPSHTPGSAQVNYQEKTNQVLHLNNSKQPLPIPTPPLLTAPLLIQNYDNNQKYEDGMHPNKQNGQDKTQEVPQYCTKSYTTEIDYGTQEYTEFPNVSPVPQTYSGSVTSRSSVYPQSENVFIPKPDVQQPEMDSVESPDSSLPSPEAFTAVSRIMAGPTSHQAVTVTHRTRHRYDEMDEDTTGRSSAAKNLTSVLIKFSSASQNNKNLKTCNQSSSKSPTAGLRKKEDDEVQSCKQNSTLHSSKKSLTIDRLRQDATESQWQHHLVSKPSQREAKPPTSPIIRHHSEPDITSMISDEQFMEYQQQLQRKAAEHINDSRSSVYQTRGNGIFEGMGYPRYSSGPGRGLGQFTNTGSVPGLAQKSDHLLSMSTRVRPASTESLITTTSTEELQESGESVLTTRLQIPVYNNGNKVQNVAKIFPNAPRSSSLHDVSGRGTPSDNTATSPNPPPSFSPSVTLRKSESWHQLVAGQQGIRNKRPQSLALPDLTIPGGNARRIPPTLPKTKSSHSLSFPKQFEAALSPESVETKQRKVEAYLKTSVKPKTYDTRKKVQESQENSVPPPSEMLDLDDNLENVDEAFENVFNAAVSSNSESMSKRSTTHKVKRPQRQPATEERFPSHLSHGPSSQFARKQQAWEDSSMVRTKLAQHLSSK